MLKSLIIRTIRGIAPKAMLPDRFARELMTRVEPVVYADHWSIQPFNGQALRFATICALAREFTPTVGIETGTYIGSSTPYLATLVTGRTHTIEISGRSAAKAARRFNMNHSDLEIELHVGDSAKVIQQILRTLDPQREVVLAYLDAHWLDAIPTKSEINSLLDWGGRFLAIVDDFQVPSDAGFGFDAYGKVTIGLGEVPESPLIQIWCPEPSSKRETGAKRGTGYIVHYSLVPVFGNISELGLVRIR